jgi:hypothetical protein
MLSSQYEVVGNFVVLQVTTSMLDCIECTPTFWHCIAPLFGYSRLVWVIIVGAFNLPHVTLDESSQPALGADLLMCLFLIGHDPHPKY